MLSTNFTRLRFTLPRLLLPGEHSFLPYSLSTTLSERSHVRSSRIITAILALRPTGATAFPPRALTPALAARRHRAGVTTFPHTPMTVVTFALCETSGQVSSTCSSYSPCLCQSSTVALSPFAQFPTRAYIVTATFVAVSSRRVIATVWRGPIFPACGL